MSRPSRITRFSRSQSGARLVTVNGQVFVEDDENQLVTINGQVYEQWPDDRVFVPAVAESPAVSVDAGSLSLTGQAPTVEVTGGQNIEVNVPAGSLTISGKAPTATATISVAPAAETVVITGQAPTVTVTANHIRAPPKGTLTLTGFAPSAAANFIITDVDGDESVYDGQTGVVVSLQNATAASGKRVFIEQGVNVVEQQVTDQDISSATITVSFGGTLTPGAATLYCWDPI